MQTNNVSSHRSGARRLAIRAGLASAIGIVALPVVLLAHAHLRRSDPTAHERLATAPTAIRLWFTERPELGFTRARLRAADSSEIALGAPARLADDPLGVSFSIPSTLAAGSYTVIWRTAAADGHPTSGSFTFEVEAHGIATAAAPDSGRRPTGNALIQIDSTPESLPSLNVSAATRWLEFMAMLAVIGAVVFRLVVLPGAARTLAGALTNETRLEIVDSVRRLAQSALILLLIAAASRLYAEARALLGAGRAVDRSALRTTLATGWGVGWLVGVAGIAIVASGFVVVRRARRDGGWTIAALGALAIACAPALTGHASTVTPVAVALVADVVHVLAASAWLGALLAILFAALPLVRARRSITGLGSGPLVASLVRAFHPVALACAATVVVSGVVSAWLRLPTVASLWETTYGRVLLLKLAFVAIVVVLGALNWRRILPTLGDEAAARRITRTASAELTIAALVLAVTAVLVSTSPPDRALPAPVNVQR